MSQPAPQAELDGRRALVMGLGAFGGGLGAARYLTACGARVTATDLRPDAELPAEVAELAECGVRLVLGRHAPEDFEAADLVVPNPAVAPGHPLLAAARAAGARVVSAVELFLEATRGDVVGITGTQGKSSTSMLLADLLAGAGRRVHLGGNIGGSLLEHLDAIQPGDVVVLELSSYQLEALSPEAPRKLVAATVLNVLADHLERHGTRAAYRAAKLRILELLAAGGIACLPDELELRPTSARGATRAATGIRELRFGAREPGATGLTLTADAFERDGQVLAPRSALRVCGDFQHWNALVALGLAHALGVAPETLARALPGAGVPEHRLQDLGRRGGLRVWDNAVSTAPDSTLAALRSLDGPLVLLLGGRLKRDLDLEPLAREAAARARSTIVFGEAAVPLSEALEAAGATVVHASDVPSALAEAYAHAAEGDALLFSPACSSFDAYANFRARAEHFRELLPPATELAGSGA